MVTEDQADVISFLASPAAHDGQAVERVDTHASVVFLAGAHALKLKRAVRYDYLDFSTPERRRTMCEAELQVNRRTAPALYQRVRAVTRAPDGRLALDGAGTPLDWVLEMARFDQDALLDRLAERGALTLALMPQLARTIARFHAAAEPRADRGGAAAMQRVVDGNEAGFAEHGGDALETGLCRRLGEASRLAVSRCGALLDRRREAGFVRQCHGDLHLRNIVLLDGVATLFDGIEFNDDLSCVDVAYDVAFLLMDLWHRRLPGHAHAVWNAYQAETDDVEALRLLPLFLSCRAAIRAKTGATAAALAADSTTRARLGREAADYLALADELLRPPPPRVIAVGGLSGTGKSTLALALAPGFGPVPGAVVIRSDEVRKRLAGVDPLARLPAEAYSAAASNRVYEAMADQAARIVAAGHAVVLDAVYAESRHRQQAEQVAAAAGVSFAGVWLDAAAEVLVRRVSSRRGDASDADADVVRAQLERGSGQVSWNRVDAGGDPDRVLAAAAGLLAPERAFG